MTTKLKKREKTATGRDIREITGALDERTVRAILCTGATRDEILQAFDWLQEDYHTKSATPRRMSEHIRHVYYILDYAYNGFSKGKP